MYAMFLPAWWAVWPKQALLIMRNEDYQSAPRQHMQAGFMFLGKSEACAAVVLLTNELTSEGALPA